MKPKWRIFRVPGSRQWWHIDCGQGTGILSVKSWRGGNPRSVDVGGNNHPRAWIEVEGEFYMFPNGEAVFI